MIALPANAQFACVATAQKEPMMQAFLIVSVVTMGFFVRGFAPATVQASKSAQAPHDVQMTVAAAKNLACDKLVSQEMVTAQYGAIKKFKVKATGCTWSFRSSTKGFMTGTVGGFDKGPKAYDQMLRGAKISLKKYGEVQEVNDLGKKSFTFVGKPFGMPGVQVGFLTSNGRYAVNVAVSGTSKPSLAKVQALAKEIDKRLSKK